MGFALGNKMRSNILFVESQPDDVLMIQQVFQEKPDVVLRVVSSPTEALDFLKGRNVFTTTKHPHLIIVGNEFDNTEQLDILKEIKGDVSLRTIPVTILSSSDSEQEIGEAYALYANCCIVKPSCAEEFISMLHVIVQYWIHTTLLGSM